MSVEGYRSEIKISFSLSIVEPVEEEEEEEIIRCTCNIFRDEGLMIQCEKCLVKTITDITLLF